MIPLLDPRFELGDYLGSGSHGDVYKAWDRLTETSVAVKFLKGNSPRRMARFRQEVRAQANLSHPSVVQIIAYGEGSAGPWLAMEYVDGAELDRALGRVRGTLPEGDPWPGIRGAVTQLLQVLAEVHSREFIHRDLKPGNIMMDREGNLRLLDFGLSMASDDPDGATTTGTVVGTMAYVAPEVLGGQRATRRSDLYAVGVITYLLLTGELPYHAQSMMDLHQAHLEGRPPRPKEKNPRVSDALDEWVHRLLWPQPSDRIASAVDALRRLQEAGLVEKSTGPVPSRAPLQRPSPLLNLGREAELAMVMEVGRGVITGGSAVVVLLGPSGIGKSWCLEQVTSRLTREGFAVAGRPGAYPRQGPGSLLEDGLRTLSDLSGSERKPKEYGELVTTVLGIPPEDLQRPAAAHARKLRSFEGVLRLLEDASRKGPVAWVIDQIHQGDEVAADLVRYLETAVAEGALAHCPVLILHARREDAGSPSPRPRSSPTFLPVVLGPLSEETLRQTFAAEPAMEWEIQEAGARLHAASLGIPHRVRHTLERWLEANWIRRTPRGLELTQKFLTAGQETIEEMENGDPDRLPHPLPRLSHSQRETLARMAAVGPVAELALLRNALGIPALTLNLHLESFLDAKIITEEIIQDEVLYRFVDERLAETLQEELEPEEHRLLHQRAALWLEAHPLIPAQQPGRIARHHRARGAHGVATRWFLLEGERARARQARREAHSAFVSAVEEARLGGDELAEAAALRGLAEECRILARFSQGLETTSQLRELGRRFRSPSLCAEADVLAAGLLIHEGSHIVAGRYLRQAIAGAPEGTPVAAEARMRLAQVRQLVGRTRDAVPLLDETIRLYADLGDARGEARARINRALLAHQLGDHKDALRRHKGLRKQLLSPDLLPILHSNHALVLLEAGEPEKAMVLLEQALAGFEMGEDPITAAHTLAMIIVTKARLHQHLDPRFPGVLAFSRRAGLSRVEAILYHARALALWNEGLRDGTRRDLTRARTRFKKAGLPVQACVVGMDVARALAQSQPLVAHQCARKMVGEIPRDMLPSLRWQVHALAASIARNAGQSLDDDRWTALAKEEFLAFLTALHGPHPTAEQMEAERKKPRLLITAAEFLSGEEEEGGPAAHRNPVERTRFTPS